MKNKRKSTTDRLGSYLTAAVGIGTLAGTADATIVAFLDNGSFIEGTIDDDDQPIAYVTLGDGSVLQIDPFSAGSYLELRFGALAGRFTGAGTFNGGLYPGVSLLTFGDPIFANNAGRYPEIASLVADYSPQPDFVGNVSGFIGFVTPNGNEGWLAVSFNSDTGLFAYGGGAVATAGEELTAGNFSAIPEPVSMLSTMGMLASGLLIRRRKRAA